MFPSFSKIKLRRLCCSCAHAFQQANQASCLTWWWQTDEYASSRCTLGLLFLCQSSVARLVERRHHLRPSADILPLLVGCACPLPLLFCHHCLPYPASPQSKPLVSCQDSTLLAQLPSCWSYLYSLHQKLPVPLLGRQSMLLWESSSIGQRHCLLEADEEAGVVENGA